MKKKIDREEVAVSSDSFLKQIDEMLAETTQFLQSVKTDPLGHILEGLNVAKKKETIIK